MSENEADVVDRQNPMVGLVALGLLGIFFVVLCIVAISVDSLDLRDAERRRVQQEEVAHGFYLRRMFDGSQAMLQEGAEVYAHSCLNCHGVDGNLGLVQSRRLGMDALENTLYGSGSHPLALYSTVTKGFRMMPAQTYLSVDQRYAVIYFVREQIIKLQNSKQYTAITSDMIQAVEQGISEAGLNVPSGAYMNKDVLSNE